MMKVNFIGQRYLIERCIDDGLMPPGSAVGIISSGAGLGWERNLPVILELLDTPDFPTAAGWCEAHADLCQYPFSKQVVIAYCARRAFTYLKKAIRINALCPTSTDTPLARRSFRLARVWHRLPHCDQHRRCYPARAGIPTSIPLQRRGELSHGYNPGCRRRRSGGPGHRNLQFQVPTMPNPAD